MAAKANRDLSNQKPTARASSFGFLPSKQLTIIFLFEDGVKRWLIPLEQDWPRALLFPPLSPHRL